MKLCKVDRVLFDKAHPDSDSSVTNEEPEYVKSAGMVPVTVYDALSEQTNKIEPDSDSSDDPSRGGNFFLFLKITCANCQLAINSKKEKMSNRSRDS